MNIAIISATTFPASLPDDITATQGYGSESSMATLAGSLSAILGHNVEFYAPTGSSRYINRKVRYHPIRNSHGDHIDEVLDNCALDGSKYTDLLNVDFVISGEKLCNNIEQLHYHNPIFKKYCCYRSGYADFRFPEGVPVEKRHYVTHCKYFQNEFKKAGHDADVCFFGINPFWSRDLTSEFWIWFEVKYSITQQGYWLFPHRPSLDKGIDVVLRLAEYFPQETFVISTATPLPDHKAVMKQCKMAVADKHLTNVKFVDVPESPYYQFHRRALLSNAKAVLCPFPYPSPYLDTGGLVGAEAMSCGTPLLVTRSPGSEEWWGAQDEKGVVFTDGADSARMAIRHWSTYDLHPTCPYNVEAYAKDYMKVIEKYTS
jgi:glycosyltransferase involved in cell wall biosynthesis